MDAILEFLYDMPLLAPLDEAGLDWLRGEVATAKFAPGDYVFREGDPSTDFYMVLSGQLETEHLENGTAQRLAYFYPKDYFGDLGLLHDEPRAVSMKATVPSTLVVVPGQIFYDLLAQYPEIEQTLLQTAEERAAPPPEFPGQEPNEVVIYWKRRHWIELGRAAATGAAAFVVLLLGIAGAYLFSDRVEAEILFVALWLIVFLPLVGWTIWEIVDWYNDYYIVTDRRVIHIERVVLATEMRHEAPLTKIQEVNALQRTALSNYLNYGNLIIQTASQSGPVIFRSIPNPGVVADRILREIRKAKEEASQEESQQKRRELRRALGLEPAPAAAAAAAGAAAKAPPAAPPSLITRTMDYLRPTTREQKNGAIIWRKHWIVLLAVSWMPLLFGIVWLTGAAALVILTPRSFTSLEMMIGGIVGIILTIATIAWLLWEYADWRNDVYVLTPNAIVDEERKPLGLSQEVRRANLEQIQDVRYAIPNPVLMLFNVGHVFVQTAGTEGHFTFKYVANPREVQYEIFQNIEKLLSQKKARESARLNQEMLELLRLYREETSRPALPPPVAAAPTEPPGREPR